jgi:hypothetical protein
MNIFDDWMSFNFGDEVEFEPIGMWGQRVWQNKCTFKCSGERQVKNCESFVDHYDYRFTQVGDGSVGADFSDIILRGKDILAWYKEGKPNNEIHILGGYIILNKSKEL